MCKEMLVIPFNRVLDKKRTIGKNGRPRRTPVYLKVCLHEQ
jgi:hypothetical protein